MTMKSVMVQFTEEQIATLDREAKRTGASRAAVVRSLIDRYRLPKSWDPVVAAQYERAYPDGKFGVDEWGDLDAWHDAARRDQDETDVDPW